MKTALSDKNYIGHKIKVKNINGETLEGEIFSYDTSLDILAIRNFF